MIQANEAVAVELLRTAIKHDPDAILVGGVSAKDLARFAASIIGTCPKCGATAWVNIDCDLCGVCSSLGSPSSSPATENGECLQDCDAAGVPCPNREAKT